MPYIGGRTPNNYVTGRIRDVAWLGDLGGPYLPILSFEATAEAGVAAGTGAAFDPQVFSGTIPFPEVAAGSGAAFGAAPSVAVNAGVASGSGTAYDARIVFGGETVQVIWVGG